MQPTSTNNSFGQMSFSSNPGNQKRVPPMGGASIMAPHGGFPSMMGMGLPGMPVPGMPGPMPGGMAIPMGGAMPPGMPMGAMQMGSMGSMGAMSNLRMKNQVKEMEFAKGLFIYDFEQSVTSEMLFKHFNDIKPVSIIKFPKTKQRFSKKFAFVYFRTAEDAQEVKDVIEKDCEAEEKAIAAKAPQAELDKLKSRHRILKKVIRVSSLAVNREQKLMLKPKYDKDGPDAKNQLKKIQEEYFNIRNLEQEVKRIIKDYPEYKFSKLLIPKDPQNPTQYVPYGRVFFDLYHSNQIEEIKELLEKDEKLSKYVEVLPFKQQMNNTNMLYIKGFAKTGESLDGIEKQLKEKFESLNPTWNVNGVFVKSNEGVAWGYVTFATAEQCRQAFELLKPLKTTFRGNVIYANIKNQADPRTVMIYNLKESVTLQQVTDFFKQISKNSKRVEPKKSEIIEGAEGAELKKQQSDRGIFDFYDISILDKRVAEHDHEKVQISRRMIISFMDAVEGLRIQELVQEITSNPHYKTLFNDGKFKARSFRPYKIQGHLDRNDKYVPHRSHLNPENRNRNKKAPDGKFSSNKGMNPRKPQIKTGYTPIMNVPRPPGGKMGSYPNNVPSAMGKSSGYNNRPYPGMVPPMSMAPSGMGMTGSNPMAFNPMMGSKQLPKPSNQSSTVGIGMQMPANMNPISQMSYASGMRPPNHMGSMGTLLGGQTMGVNPMMNPMGMSNPMGNPMSNPMNNPMSNPMSNPMGNPMGNTMIKPFPPTGSVPPQPTDKKPPTQQNNNRKDI